MYGTHSYFYRFKSPPPVMEFSINFGIASRSLFFTLTHFFQTVNTMISTSTLDGWVVSG